MLQIYFALKLISIALLSGTIFLACKVDIEKTIPAKPETSQTSTYISNEETLTTLRVDSHAMPEDVYFPHQYTCKDTDVSPPLQWSNVPKGTRSFALILDDPDAIGGTFVHWVVYNIPPGVTSLEENLPRTETLPNGSIQGTNDFGNLGYNGPCPQGAFGKVHGWVFSVYALDIEGSLAPRATNAELMNIISGHILAKGVLIRKYRAPSTSYGKYIPGEKYLSIPYSK